MIFVDEARIFVKAGDGGKGCESFYSDRFTRHPRPDGGNGGKGGDVVFVADPRIQTLLDYRFKQHYKAAKGANGGSKGKKGRDGEDLILRVPVGTILKDHDTGLWIKDLVSKEQSVTVARGGQGGQGNAHKRQATHPKSGEEKTIHLELKLIADVGLVGFPNAGKSTFISSISRVKSPVASYPFTTKKPILGIVELNDDFSFVVADLPGLIEGAHQGWGLGDRFLKHAERTKVLLHVIDMGAAEGRDPIEDFEKINTELQKYSDSLFLKFRIVVGNKMDLPAAAGHLKRFKKKYKGQKVFPISALQKTGFKKLLELIRDILSQPQGVGG